MENNVKKPGCFDVFHLFPNLFLQSRGMSRLISCGGERNDRTCALAIFTLSLRARLWLADNTHCSLLVQLECSWCTQVHVARSGFSSFFLGSFPEIPCHCPSVMPLLMHQGSITSFAGIDVEQAISHTVLGSHGSRDFEGEISSRDPMHWILSVLRG